jgi:hypothetical protein
MAQAVLAGFKYPFPVSRRFRPARHQARLTHHTGGYDRRQSSLLAKHQVSPRSFGGKVLNTRVIKALAHSNQNVISLSCQDP